VPLILQRALEALLAGETPWPGYVFGRTGSGKTCAGLLVFDAYEAVWLEARTLADRCWEDGHVLWRQAARVPLVIVDEVGAGTTDRDWLGLKRLADLRVNRPTLWISNLTPDALLEAFDERIYSRLCCGTVVGVVGPDQRFQPAARTANAREAAPSE